MKYLILFLFPVIWSCLKSETEVTPRTVTPPNVWINEYHYSNANPTANQEFIEIAGETGFNLSNIVIQLYKNWNGKVYSTRTLTGTIPSGSNGIGFIRFTYPTNTIIDTLGGIAVWDKSTNNLLQFISYNDTITAVNGLAAGNISELVSQTEGNGPSDISIQKIGSGRTYVDFNWSGPSIKTPNVVNSGQTITP